jgi:ATP-dependent helicase/nuclease subunit A
MSINNQYPIDYSVRQEALGPGSFILEAPAGSGKTSILIKRFLTLLLAVDKPTEIIALTFTNKAAMEMRKRIVEALEGKGTDGETTNITNKVLDRAKKLKWGDEFPYSLMIMTIDKLAMQLIAQTPILSQSGKLLKIDTNPEELYLASIKEAINDNNDLKPLFSYLKNDYTKIATQALELIKKRDQWLPYINSYSMMSEA